MHATGSSGGIVDAHIEVEPHRLHGFSCHTVDFRLQERTQGIVHGERTGVAIGEIHARCQHGNGHLATSFHRHGLQLVADTHVIGCIDDKFESQLTECLGKFHTAIEIHYPTRSRAFIHGRLHMLGGSDVETGIKRVAGKLDVAAVLYGEGLERDNGQRILHLTVAEGVASGKCEFVYRIIAHHQIAATHQVDIVGMVGIEHTQDTGSLVDGQAQPHVQARDDRPLHHLLGGVAEVGKGNQFVELVVCRQFRIAHDIGHIRAAQHIYLAAHSQVVHGTGHQRHEVDKRLAIRLRPWILLGVDELEVACLHAQIHRHAVEIAKIEVTRDGQR